MKSPRSSFDPDPPAVERPSLLVVDDMEAGRVATRAVLDTLDAIVFEARSGREALRLVLDRDFAVILLDVNMPIMDGFETAARIRELDRAKQVPIIFHTSTYEGEFQRFKGYAAGAVDFLVEPVAPEVLRSKAAVFLDLFRKTEHLRHFFGKPVHRGEPGRRPDAGLLAR